MWVLSAASRCVLGVEGMSGTGWRTWARRCAFRQSQEKRNSLLGQLLAKIRMCGPITVADYMRECLTHPSLGYYMCADVFGPRGDFVTSPEISPMFGEMLGVWFLSEWMKLGEPTPVQVVELGPGRGTLVSDVLKVMCRHEPFRSNVTLHLVEVSPRLRAVQKQALESCAVSDVEWHSRFDTVPTGRFTLWLAHEFFDALPVHVLKRQGGVWGEVLVDMDSGGSESKLRFVVSKHETPVVKALGPPPETGDLWEVCPQAGVIAQRIGQRIHRDGGVFLVVDYGHNGASGVDSFRAYRRHEQTDPLSRPGETDLTADVDFSFLQRWASSGDNQILCYGPVSQADFLLNIGMKLRLEVFWAGIKRQRLRMKLLQYLDPAGSGETCVGVVVPGDGETRVVPCPGFRSVLQIILGSKDRDADLLPRIPDELSGMKVLDLSKLELLPPVTGQDKVLCVGMNYRDHCEEQGMPVPTEPVVFNKFPSTLIGAGCPIRVESGLTDQVDYEVELALVIGKAGKNIPEDRAHEHIFGYAVANDVSARDWQLTGRNANQWLLSKAMDTFCPLGPWLVTSDEVAGQDLRLVCRVNGETRQESSTKQMVFDSASVVAYASKFCTLLPGDVILTGTPPGVGVFRKPPVFLRDGDVVDYFCLGAVYGARSTHPGRCVRVPRCWSLRMKRRYAKKVVRLVKCGALDSYVRRKDLDPVEVCGLVYSTSRRRLVLHELCRRGQLSFVVSLMLFARRRRNDDALRRLVLAADARGDTPVHLAVLQARKHASARGPDDPVVEMYCELARHLMDAFVDVAHVRNAASESPVDLLDSFIIRRCPEEVDASLWEPDDHDGQDFERYFSDFADVEPETLSKWADRMREERRAKHASFNRKAEEKMENEEKKQKQKTRAPSPLPILDGPSRSETCVEEVHVETYNEFRRTCERLKVMLECERSRTDGDAVDQSHRTGLLSLLDAFGGVDAGLPALEAALRFSFRVGVDSDEATEKRRYVRDQLRLWHPDKFDQKLAVFLTEEEERARCAAFFAAVSRILLNLDAESR
ncbi:unnamed protein product [Notodromas monacha]|uniref:type II protein arginine methyltransferase n=1 Tax=Notodromas monacha TaxID=399045 RepID=A0A7R9G8W3_9CRUS|nr:unnamed protein product [Notodromas monacha]CAG0913685.1 unnamed protein product [Notodromas monacha]